MNRIVRFEGEDSAIHLGLWEPGGGDTEEAQLGRARLLEGDLYDGWRVTDQAVEVRRLLAPIEPVNIFGIGLNYRAHAAEGQRAVPDKPLIFIKATSAVAHPGDHIVLPRSAPDQVDFEAELAVVIGRKAKDVSAEQALDYVLGYTCANDVSARDCQKKLDAQWARAKSFDTFCPLGPCLVPAAEFDPTNARVRSWLNGKLMQDDTTASLIFPVAELVSYLSRQFTLLPGTVICTGTPAGVGFARDPQVFLRPGDTILVKVEGIGQLSNPVRSDA